MVKAMTFFLIIVIALAVFGKLGWIGRSIGLRKPPTRTGALKSCPRCGRYIIGKGPCDCGLPPPDNKG